MKKVNLLLIILLFMQSTLLFSKTVRVGFFTDAKNLMSLEGYSEAKNGYAYEFIQTLSSYTDWEFEYVYGNWDTLYQALLNNQIDILPDVSKSDEREGKILYPDYPMGRESYYLYTTDKSKISTPGDYSSWKDKTIGLRNNCYHYDLFMEWKKTKKIDCKLVEFNISAPYQQWFENKQFDYLLEIEILANPEWNPVVKIGESEFYLAVSNSRPDLLEELNMALSDLYSMNPYYNNILWMKYFSESSATKSLTKRELTWIQENPLIVIGCLRDDLPFTDYNNHTHTAEGVIISLSDLLPIYFNLDNTTITYKFYDDYAKMFSDLKNGYIHAVAPAYRNLSSAEQSGLILSEKFSTIIMGCAYDKNNKEAPKRIAIPKKLNISEAVHKLIPDSEVFSYDSYADCMNAVLNGYTDCAIFNIYKMRALMNKNKKYKSLHAIELSSNFDMAYIVSKKNKPLATIINKLIMLVPDETISSMLEINAVKEQSLTKQYFIENYMEIITISLILFSIMLISLIYAIGQIKDYIEHDTLTKLLNRRNLDKYIDRTIKDADEEGKAFSMLLFDLDNFKRINDTYGHDFGDQVLITVAKIIKENISETDLAFRWGGEEFLVICQGNQGHAFLTAEKIRKKIAGTTLNCEGAQINFTITIGISLYTKGCPYKELFRRADENLYKGKENGKNQVVV